LTKVDLQYDVINLTPADANPVESNFSRIEQHINQELVERDGTVAMRAQLKLVGDPVNAFDAAPKQYVDAVLPVGIIMMFGGVGAPPGGRWAECNGAELQTALYPDLAAILGTRYVTGTPTTGRFNLPNLNGKFAMGTDGTTAVGGTGGSRNAIVAPHTHPIDHAHPAGTTGDDAPDHGHQGADHLHGVNINSGGESNPHYHFPNSTQATEKYVGWRSSGGFGASGGGTNFTLEDTTNFNNVGHSHNVSGATGAADRVLNSAGASVRHQHPFTTPAISQASGAASGAVSATDANMPPYVTVTYIIRVA
jgi:microcystin-dependent protein